LRVLKHNSGVRHCEIEGGEAVKGEMRTSLVFEVPAENAEGRLVIIWMTVGSTDWFSNLVSWSPIVMA